jgi:transcriptional regulator GlxA family with amidase domain
VIASLLAVPDAGLFVTTFVTMYSGLIPMLATAGNTTNDGFVGAIINDRLMDWTAVDGEPAVASFAPDTVPYPRAVRAAAAFLLGPALWMIVAPQARIGLSALQWMSRSTFRGEALVGAAILLVALTGLLGGKRATSSPI